MLYLIFLLSLALASDIPRDFTEGNNKFSAAIYEQFKGVDGNFVLSPLGLQLVMALAQAGANEGESDLLYGVNNTAEEIRYALGLPATLQKIEEAVESLRPALARDDAYTLQSANKIYIKTGFEVKEEFKREAAVFGAEVENADFDSGAEAVKKINQWVEDKTRGTVKDLMAVGDLNDRSRLVLVNALYFKGNWSFPFKSYNTHEEDFYRNGEEVVKRQTMYRRQTRNYFLDKDLKAEFLELPFEGNDITLTIVLPQEKTGLPSVENQLGLVFKRPVYTAEDVKVSLPKFKFESGFDLKGALQQLGVKKAFDKDKADFSKTAGEKGDLVIDVVKQKTFIDLNENGVEAAAATYAVEGIPLSGLESITPPKEFNADHPFLFYIKYKDVVLFAGRVVDPVQ